MTNTPNHDSPHLDDLLSRRGFLHMGLVAGAGALVAGCASSTSTRVADLPDPKWPESAARPSLGGRPRLNRPLSNNLSYRSGVDYHGDLPSGVLARSSWARGKAIPRRMDRLPGVSRITIHHDGMPPVAIRTQRDAASRLEMIRVSHLGRNFGDIGYHYVIDPSGRVWEGRSLTWQGAHVRGQNERNLGILVMGNFEKQRPSKQSLARLDQFVTQQMHRYGVSLNRVHTHRELASTVCPGQNLQVYMNRTRGAGGALALA